MDPITILALLLHVATTFAMVGLIWFVQIVHYPLFSQVGRNEFHGYESRHQRLTTWVVAPLMLVELVTAIFLLWHPPVGVGSVAIWFGICLLGFIWLITFSVQVPQHAALAKAYQPETQRRLVTGNWFRTIAWSMRGMLVLWMVGQVALHAIANPVGEHLLSR